MSPTTIGALFVLCGIGIVWVMIHMIVITATEELDRREIQENANRMLSTMFN